MMLEQVGTSLTTVISWCGEVISSLTATEGELSALLPLWAIGVSISALLLGVKIIKSFAWGT